MAALMFIGVPAGAQKVSQGIADAMLTLMVASPYCLTKIRARPSWSRPSDLLESAFFVSSLKFNPTELYAARLYETK